MKQKKEGYPNLAIAQAHNLQLYSPLTWTRESTINVKTMSTYKSKERDTIAKCQYVI